MYQLNYRSQARKDLQMKDLEAILSSANLTNTAFDISGCLIFHNGYFLQILEGDKEDVLAIYEKIKKDSRHEAVTLLGESVVEKRTFPEWNMAYHEPEDKSMRQFVHNLILVAEFSDKSSESLKSFWLEVRKILLGGK